MYLSLLNIYRIPSYYYIRFAAPSSTVSIDTVTLQTPTTAQWRDELASTQNGWSRPMMFTN